MPDLFKEVIPSIMQYKKNVFKDDAEADQYFQDNAFIINRSLSMHMDCLYPANYMNMSKNLDGKLKYDFLLNTVRGYKRPFNYAKSKKYDDLSIVQEYYGVNYAVAVEYHRLLTPEKIEAIKTLLNRGGTIQDNNKKWNETNESRI